MFENTSTDMNQCLGELREALENGQSFDQFVASRSSDYEQRAVRQLFEMSKEFVELVEELQEVEEVDDEVEDEPTGEATDFGRK